MEKYMKYAQWLFWGACFLAALGFSVRREYPGMIWVVIAALENARSVKWYNKWKVSVEEQIQQLKDHTDFIRRMKR